MALLFIHGVNNRNTDEGYRTFHNMRRSLTESLVIEPLAKSFPNFAQVEDAYWGDLGVKFDYGLSSIPQVRVIGHLGTTLDSESPFDFTSLMILLEQSDSKSLTALLEKEDPAIVFSVLVEPMLISSVRDETVVDQTNAMIEQDPSASVNSEDGRTVGVSRSYLIRAADELAEDGEFLKRLAECPNDAEFLSLFQTELVNAAIELASKSSGAVEELSTLGPTDTTATIDSIVSGLCDGIKGVTSKIKAATLGKALRAGSLAALEWKRTEKSRTALLFFGDVFEYLKRGWSEDGESITRRVALRILAAYKQSKNNGEPFVVVTHSFGSMIFFDLMTSYSFEEPITVDLWAMAGAQVSLFAEMRLFKDSARNPGKNSEFLSKPETIRKWVNFYDQSDLFSYLAEPVFGQGNVTDIEFRQNANLKTAHGDYFAQPSFYRRLLSEIPATAGSSASITAK